MIKNAFVHVWNTFIGVWEENTWLKILTITSIVLLLWGFYVPPQGEIHGSVIMGVGELAGFGALWEFAYSMRQGLKAKLRIKELELEIAKHENEEETEEQ